MTDSATGQSWIEWDLVYRGPGGPLLAAHGTPDHRPQPETLMIHTDHLGSVRFLTDGGGHARSYHAYLPFGEEATATHADLLRYRFTGHERELLSPTTPTDDLDNLHARIGNPMLGRFTSTDPVQSPPGNPQGANRYAYVQGNPLTYTDPTGEMATAAMLGQWIESSIEELKEDLTRKVTTGGVGGVVAATAVGSTLDLVSIATDGLKAGDAVGTAVGSGAGAGKVARAVAVDAGRAATLALPGASSLRLFGKSAATVTTSARGAASGGAPFADPTFAAQLERQLAKDGSSSVFKSLRSLEKRMAEHQAKLPDLEFKSSVEREIKTFQNQIETLKEFIDQKGLTP